MENKYLQLGQHVLFNHAWPLLGMYPEHTCQDLACQDELSPVLPALHVSLVGTGVPEAQANTNDETRHCEKDRAHAH